MWKIGENSPALSIFPSSNQLRRTEDNISVLSLWASKQNKKITKNALNAHKLQTEILSLTFTVAHSNSGKSRTFPVVPQRNIKNYCFYICLDSTKKAITGPTKLSTNTFKCSVMHVFARTVFWCVTRLFSRNSFNFRVKGLLENRTSVIVVRHDIFLLCEFVYSSIISNCEIYPA